MGGHAGPPIASHQTVRLSQGVHRDPADGACVMELASMLAGEPFSDRPSSVSLVIGSYLRVYNDGIDEVRRQGLYWCAAAIVGSRRDQACEQRRIGYCYRLVGELQPSQPHLRRRRCPQVAGASADVGAQLARVILRLGPSWHTWALALVDELIAMGAAPAPATIGAVLPARRTATGPKRVVRI